MKAEKHLLQKFLIYFYLSETFQLLKEQATYKKRIDFVVLSHFKQNYPEEWKQLAHDFSYRVLDDFLIQNGIEEHILLLRFYPWDYIWEVPDNAEQIETQIEKYIGSTNVIINQMFERKQKELQLKNLFQET